MTILVDSHVFLWFASGDVHRLRRSALDLMQTPDVRLRISVVSIWELTIKYALGRLALPLAPGEFFPAEIARAGYELLPIDPAHVYRMASLPPHHRGPFDRLLVAQALVERIPLLTHDGKLPLYRELGAEIIPA